MTGSVQLLRANALDLPIADSTVDLVVTSPPYFGLRSYQDGGEHFDGQIGDEATPGEFVDALLAATREMIRVLKPSGSIFVNLGDKYAGTTSSTGGNGYGGSSTLEGGVQVRDRNAATFSRPIRSGVRAKSLIGVPWRYALRCIDDLGLILRAEIIWAKPNGLPESVTDRVARKHETWFHFTTSESYYANLEPIREPYRSIGTGTSERFHEHAKDYEEQRGDDGRRNIALQTSGRPPSSYWVVPTQGLTIPESLGVDHFAAYPVELPRRIISGWCPPGGLVLDPFGGTGTTAAVARALDRDALHVDLSNDYLRIAEWRTTGTGYPDVVRKVRAGQIRPDRATNGRLAKSTIDRSRYK